MTKRPIGGMGALAAQQTEGLPLFETRPHYNGPEYDPARDQNRLIGQTLRVFDAMKDGRWQTLQAIADATGDPPASVSAQLRHLRKDRFGGHAVERRHVSNGLYEYSLIVNKGAKP
jgi:hypothetical protein